MSGRGRYALAVMLAMLPLRVSAGEAPQQAEKQGGPHRSSPTRSTPLPAVPPPMPVAPPPPVVWPTLPAGASRPTVVGSPGEFFGSDAYPPAAIRAEEEGRTVARLLIDPSGTPQVCEVQTSSGSATLDDATCRIARLHLRFTPAHDAQGKALAGIYVLPVRWVLPEPAPLPRISVSSVTQAEMNPNGVVTSCTTRDNGIIVRNVDGDLCAQIRHDPALNKLVIAPLGGKRATIWAQSVMTFDGDVAAPEEHKRADRTVLGVARAHLTVAPDGAVTACEMTEQVGDVGQRPICRSKPARFVPHATGTKGGATVLMAFSMAPAPTPAATSRGARRGVRTARRRR